MTSAQRRAYIDTKRRLQSIDELRRKARKAKRRRPWVALEEIDLAFGVDYERDRDRRARYFTNPPDVFCSQCSSFGAMPWDEARKRYQTPPLHKPRCTYAGDDGPYPGWSAVSSPVSRESRIGGKP